MNSAIEANDLVPFNRLSKYWVSEGSSHLNCVFYVAGAVGYALSTVIRVADLALAVFRMSASIITFGSVPFEGARRHLFQAVGYTLVAPVGCLCPPLAYKLDKIIYDSAGERPVESQPAVETHTIETQRSLQKDMTNMAWFLACLVAPFPMICCYLVAGPRSDEEEVDSPQQVRLETSSPPTLSETKRSDDRVIESASKVLWCLACIVAPFPMVCCYFFYNPPLGQHYNDDIT